MNKISEKDMRLSKYVSLILRHKPEVIGIELDKYGYADIDELVSLIVKKDIKIARKDIERIVRQDDKRRYKIKDNKIRASQGHSIPVDLELKEIYPVCDLYHGTAKRFLDSILKKGLVKGSRNYVHLSDNIETAKKVGERHGEPVVLKIDEQAMYSKGYQFYVSDNGIYLTDHVPAEYISIVEE